MWNFAQTLDHRQQKLEDCGYEGKKQALREKKDWILFCSVIVQIYGLEFGSWITAWS